MLINNFTKLIKFEIALPAQNDLEIDRYQIGIICFVPYGLASTVLEWNRVEP